MPIAKKATRADTYLKILVWGEPGAGKSRMALSAPAPLVIDLERGTRLYADEFDFWVAEPTPELPAHRLVGGVVTEVLSGTYPDRMTLVIDPITDYLDLLESELIDQYKREAEAKGKPFDLGAMKAPQKAQFYARIKDEIKSRLQRLLSLPMHIVFVARAKNVWTDEGDGKGLRPTSTTFDAKDIVEYLCDIVIHLQRGGVAHIRKSRLANLPNAIKAATFADLSKALETPPLAICRAALKAVGGET